MVQLVLVIRLLDSAESLRTFFKFAIRNSQSLNSSILNPQCLRVTVSPRQSLMPAGGTSDALSEVFHGPRGCKSG